MSEASVVAAFLADAVSPPRPASVAVSPICDDAVPLPVALFDVAVVS